MEKELIEICKQIENISTKWRLRTMFDIKKNDMNSFFNEIEELSFKYKEVTK